MTGLSVQPGNSTQSPSPAAHSHGGPNPPGATLLPLNSPATTSEPSAIPHCIRTPANDHAQAQALPPRCRAQEEVQTAAGRACPAFYLPHPCATWLLTKPRADRDSPPLPQMSISQVWSSTPRARLREREIVLAAQHLSLTLCQPEWTLKKLARSGGAVMPQRQVLLRPSRVFQLTPGPP